MSPQISEIWQHYKTEGEYEIISRGRLQIKEASLDMQECVIYKALSDGEVWVRPLTDFTEMATNEKGESVPRFKQVR